MKVHSPAVSVLILVAVFISGCASQGFNRGELKSQIGVSKPVFAEQDIKEAYNKKANLPKPFKLAVYFKSPASPHRPAADWRWTPEDKAILDGIGQALKAEGLVAEVFPLVGSVVQDEDLKSLRLVAAKHQADALLVVSGAGQIDRYINGLGWSYALLVPTFFVPGSQADTLFLSNATLWDVKNEYLYLSAEAEATTKSRYIAAFGKPDKALLDEAKRESLKNLGGELRKMISGVKL